MNLNYNRSFHTEYSPQLLRNMKIANANLLLDINQSLNRKGLGNTIFTLSRKINMSDLTLFLAALYATKDTPDIQENHSRQVMATYNYLKRLIMDSLQLVVMR